MTTAKPPYRTQEPVAIVLRELARDRYTILFDGVCPACGEESWAQIGWYSRNRIHKPARRWWWQFWRPAIAYNKRRCRDCGCSVRELLPVGGE
jgi:hypothetical protein